MKKTLRELQQHYKLTGLNISGQDVPITETKTGPDRIKMCLNDFVFVEIPLDEPMEIEMKEDGSVVYRELKSGINIELLAAVELHE